jgi:hypothetical protein
LNEKFYEYLQKTFKIMVVLKLKKKRKKNYFKKLGLTGIRTPLVKLDGHQLTHYTTETDFKARGKK